MRKRRSLFVFTAAVLLAAAVWGSIWFWRLSHYPPSGLALPHIRGPLNAFTSITMYADPADARSLEAYLEIRRLAETFPLDLKVEYRHFPVSRFAWLAPGRARELECAGQFATFWSYLDLSLRALGTPWPSAHAVATALAIAPNSYTACVGDRHTAATVDADRRDGVLRGIDTSPAVLVDGKRWSGALTFAALRPVITETIAARNTRGYMPIIGAAELQEALIRHRGPLVLDLRSATAYAALHIIGAVSLPREQLFANPSGLDRILASLRPEQFVLILDDGDSGPVFDLFKMRGISAARFEGIDAAKAIAGFPLRFGGP